VSDMPEWDGEIDPSRFPDCRREGHRMVNCGDGLWRCRNCMTERRVVDGGARSPSTRRERRG
jgi:ribosomal protein L37AE/L43A